MLGTRSAVWMDVLTEDGDSGENDDSRVGEMNVEGEVSDDD